LLLPVPLAVGLEFGPENSVDALWLMEFVSQLALMVGFSFQPTFAVLEQVIILVNGKFHSLPVKVFHGFIIVSENIN
jgi:hypothetical protein